MATATNPKAHKTTTPAAVAQVTSRLAGTVGAMIDELWSLREERREAEAKIKTINERFDVLEEQLQAKMTADGLTKAVGAAASVSFTSTVAANVEGDGGWELLYAYIKRTGYFHLLQRRVSDPAYRELLDAGKKVPGVQPFNRTRVNLRSLTTP